MGNYYLDNDDLRFYVERYIDWDTLVTLTEYEFRGDREDGHQNVQEAVDFYKDILELVGGFCADEIAPVGKLDLEPKLVDGEVIYPESHQALYEAIKEMDLHGMCVPRELGGMNVALLVYMMNIEMMARADVSICAHVGFHGGMAMAALMYSVMEGTTEVDFPTTGSEPGSENVGISKTRFQHVIDDIIAGEAHGSMDLTEPDAGSDLARLRCKAEQDKDGNWFVTGPKIFITSGDAKYHFAICRTEDAADPDDPFAGLGGLSMFLVPAWTVDKDGNKTRHVHVTRLEEKLGHHGSATCQLDYDHAPAELIGERGEGFKQMLLLMNNARVGVGFESLGLCEAAYRAAVAYAAERGSMGKTIDKHEMIADYLDEMKTEIQAIRALTFYAAEKVEVAQKLNLKLKFWIDDDEEEKKRITKQHKRLTWEARQLTPLVKYLASEKAVEHSRKAIQIHGGAGYMQEYGVEKLLRDAVVMPIYEGTSQIQALMAMKDTLLWCVKYPQKFVRKSARARWRAVSGRTALERRVAKLQSTKYQTLQFLLTRLTANKLKELRHHGVGDWQKTMTDWDPKKDFALAMLHAERLANILIDVAVSEILLEQAQKFPEREELLERWLERAEPRTRYLHDQITTTGLRLLKSLREDAGETATEKAAAK